MKREVVDVVVLGVGGFGAAALLHLASRGLTVVGVERFGVPHEQGSSTGETRVIRKAYFEDPRYVLCTAPTNCGASWRARPASTSSSASGV